MLLNETSAFVANSSRVFRQGYIKLTILLVVDLDQAVRPCSGEKI